jgi:hypothetical protein
MRIYTSDHARVNNMTEPAEQIPGAMDRAEVHIGNMGHIKLFVFWAQVPQLWFLQMACKFATHGVRVLSLLLGVGGASS